jgi:large subunit ribosomal protein L10
VNRKLSRFDRRLQEKPVALKLDEKREIVAEVNETAGKALSAVLADYRGMTVSQMTELRAKARESGVYLKVIRNTLARRAVQGTPYECLNDVLVGPTLFAFSKEDHGAAARLLRDYVRGTDKKLKVKAIAVDGQLLGPDQLERIAKLPTKEEALSMLMSVMQAPIVKLVRTFNEVPARVVRTIAAIKDQKQAAA